MNLKKINKNISAHFISFLGCISILLLLFFFFLVIPEVRRMDEVHHGEGYFLWLSWGIAMYGFYKVYSVFLLIFSILFIIEFRMHDKLAEKYRIYNKISSFFGKIPWILVALGVISAFLPYLLVIFSMFIHWLWGVGSQIKTLILYYYFKLFS